MFALSPVRLGVQALRFASPHNRIADTVYAVNSSGALRDTLEMRKRHYIGSGDMSELRLSFYGWALPTSGALTANGNSYTILAAALERTAVAATTPITFNGSRSMVINDLDNDIQSDPILPSAFGLAKFTRGEEYFVRLRVQVSTAGHKVPCDSNTGNGTGEVVYAYEAATVTISSIDATGIIGTTAGSNFSSGRKPACVLLGRFASGDPATFNGIGDSIVNGSNETGGLRGFFLRSMFDADLVSNPRGSCNFGISGGVAGAWAGTNNALPRAYLRYGKHAFEEYGTNGGTLADSQAIWAACRTAGVQKIIRVKILPRTTSTDTWQTAANQTYAAGWSSGGAKDLFNISLDGQVGLPTGVDQVITFTTLLDTDPWKWVVTGAANYATSDGIHPQAATHELAAVQLRTLWATLP